MSGSIPYWRLSGFYFFYFALLGAIVPFWNLYLSDLSYTAFDIGVLSAIMMGTKIISPYLWGWLADRSGRPVKMIRLGSLLALLTFLTVFISHSFFALAFTIATFTFFWNAVIGQFEAVTLNYLGTAYLRYGSIRAWGSVGFVVAVVILGWFFSVVDIQWLPQVMVLLLLLIWLSSLTVKEIKQSDHSENQLQLLEILRRKDVFAFLLVSLLVQFSHGPYYTFFSIYLDDIGYSRTAIGMLWGGAVVAELVLFLVMNWVLKRFSVRLVLILSLLGGSLRWLLIGYGNDSVGLIVLAQALHALSFASFHTIAVDWIRRAFGHKHQGQGQALYSAISFGLGGALGAIVSGMLWQNHAQLSWLGASVASFLAVLVVWRWIKNQPQELS